MQTPPLPPRKPPAAQLPEDVPARHFVPARSPAPRRWLPEGSSIPRGLRLPSSPSLRSRERPGPFHSHPADWAGQRTPAGWADGRTPTGWADGRTPAGWAGRATQLATATPSPADSLTRTLRVLVHSSLARFGSRPPTGPPYSRAVQAAASRARRPHEDGRSGVTRTLWRSRPKRFEARG